VVIVVVAADMKVGKRGVIPSYSDRHRRKREKINKEREFSSVERESQVARTSLSGKRVPK
jgi:hypothetical protein